MSAQGDHRPPLQLVKSAMGRSSKPTFTTHWQGSVCRRFANPRKCKHAMRGTPRAPHAGQRVYDRITRTTQAIQRTNAALHELPAGPALASRSRRAVDFGITKVYSSAFDLRPHSVLRAPVPVLRMQCGYQEGSFGCGCLRSESD